MRKPRRRAGPNALAAVRQLGRWMRLAQGHLPLAAGCSCGIGLGGVRVADLLRILAQQGCDLPEEIQTRLLAEIDRVIDSFEEIHRTRGQA